MTFSNLLIGFISDEADFNERIRDIVDTKYLKRRFRIEQNIQEKGSNQKKRTVNEGLESRERQRQGRGN